MKLFIATRLDLDKVNWDECVVQTIAAHSKEEALELASREYGVWEVNEVDFSISQLSQLLTRPIKWGLKGGCHENMGSYEGDARR